MSHLIDESGNDRRAARLELRRRLIAARETLDAAEHARRSAALEAHLEALLARLAPPTLGFCWPYRGEFDARALVMRWLAGDAARRAALPVVAARGAPLAWRRWTPGCPLADDVHGIPYPVHGEALVPQLLLIPCNGFDARGTRLGYGAGYFDRTLAAMAPPPLAVGVAFELARVDDLQPQAHDRPMDWLVTEGGAVRIA